MSKLTNKQRRFCEEYLIDLNGTQAAIRAGYSAKTARSQGQRMLTNVDIQEFLSKLQKANREKTEITRERVLSELGSILNARISDYVVFDGKNVIFKDFTELTEEQLKAIESIKQTKNGVELKLHGKNWTIERICKMLGFDKPMNIEFSQLNDESLDLIINKLIGDGKAESKSNE